MSAADTGTIVRRKLSDAVFDRLRAMIVSGEHAAGDSLPSERELMTRFGVGRPAIREAMQALANLGLVSISHGERARVRTLDAQSAARQVDMVGQMLLSTSPESLGHLKDVRSFLERGMVRRAADSATVAQVDGLRALVDVQRAARGDGAAFVDADMRFHTAIAAISGNPIYPAVSELMLGWLREYHANVVIWQDRGDQTLMEHEEIIDAIAVHDPDAAERAMTGHLERSASLYIHADAGGGG